MIDPAELIETVPELKTNILYVNVDVNDLLSSGKTEYEVFDFLAKLKDLLS